MVDAVDLDRYLPPKPAGASRSPGSVKAATPGAAAGAAAKLPVDMLRALDVQGSLGVGKLKASNLKLQNVVLNIDARDGNLRMSPLGAALYGGQYQGNVGLDVRGQEPRVNLDESLSGVRIEPLLTDLRGEAKLKGRANLKARLTASGADGDRMKKTVSGGGAFTVRDGAYKGVNLGLLARQGKALLDAARGKGTKSVEGSTQTDFSELSGTFTVDGGVIRNDNLAMKAPLLRLAGQGTADLGSERIDYTLNASLVETSKGQEGKDTEKLDGITVPIRVTGTFDEPQFVPDLAAVAKQRAQVEIDKQKKKLEGKVEEKNQGKARERRRRQDQRPVAILIANRRATSAGASSPGTGTTAAAISHGSESRRRTGCGSPRSCCSRPGSRPSSPISSASSRASRRSGPWPRRRSTRSCTCGRGSVITPVPGTSTPRPGSPASATPAPCPKTCAGLMTLPGIGRSTAGAILALALGQRHAILDGNVKRVLCRYHAIDGWPGSPPVERRLWVLAERHTPAARVAEYTQAIMDLGARLCTRTVPACGRCPIRHGCLARRHHRQTELPRARPARPLPVRRTGLLILSNGAGEVLLERRPPAGLWGGLWAFPECPADGNPEAYCRSLGLEPLAMQRGHVFRHVFTHFRLEIHPIYMNVDHRSMRVVRGQVMEERRAGLV